MAEQSGIVWIASYPKSGNTWVRTFLHNLLKACHGETGAQDINDMARFSTWELDKQRYGKFLGFDPDNRVHRGEIAATRRAVHQEVADAARGLIFVKTHNALVMDRGHPTITPAATAGAVYVVRNPLDVAISYANHAGRSIDDAINYLSLTDAETEGTDAAVYEVHGSWSQHVFSWTRNNHRALHILRYEDMISETERSFAALAKHLLIDFSPYQLQTAIEHSSFASLQAQEAENGFRERHPNATAQFFREGRPGQWKEKLTSTQIERLVRDHGEQMRRFGYLPLD